MAEEINLARLKALAEKATPGPWRASCHDIEQLTDAGKGYPFDRYPDSKDVVVGNWSDDGPNGVLREEDAAYIAALDPATVIALIARAERAEELVEKLKTGVRYLECPCCGEEGAFPTLYEDGDPTICGCGGQVSCDGEGAWINIQSEEECPKCKRPT